MTDMPAAVRSRGPLLEFMEGTGNRVLTLAWGTSVYVCGDRGGGQGELFSGGKIIL